MLTRFLYTLLLYLVAPLFLYSLYKSKPNKPKFGKRWKEHFGFTPALNTIGNEVENSVVWFHTVSVGETIAAAPLIKAYKQQNPTHIIVITTTTSTGAEQAEKLGDIAQHRYMPVDFTWAISRFIKRINPQKLLIMETELWPNTLATAAKNNIEITILNARLSERSFLSYKKFQFIFNALSKNIHQLLCQSQADADRFIALGVAPSKVNITGSLKFDIDIPSKTRELGNTLRKEIGKERPVWIVASTHQGEDEIIFEAHKKLLKNSPELLLILVPRHPERFDNVSELSRQNDFITQRRTEKQNIETTTQVYIADTMGEMLLLISVADICFMGGSLIGDKVGGHNLLEPAALEKPCLIGESYYNFKEITEQLLSVEACIICSDSESIYQSVQQLLDNKQQQIQLGKAALEIVNNNKGALQKTLDYL